MQFLLLIYGSEANSPELPTTPEGMAEMIQPWIEYDQALKDAGVFLGGEALQPVATATTVSVRDGETLLTDGPFAETKEQLGGYYLLECESAEVAQAWAAKCPGAFDGRVEVRPIMKFD